jgi:hypothetical protein
MTYSSASVEIEGHTRTAMPRARLSRLESASQPRPCAVAPLMAATRPTAPFAAVHAPNRIVSAKRLIPGQTRMTTPLATAKSPLIPSAHRNFVTCVSARLYTDSI